MIISFLLQKTESNKVNRLDFPNCNIEKNTLKLGSNVSISCLRIIRESRPSTEILLQLKLFVEPCLLAQKNEIWKKELRTETMICKIKDINFLFEYIEPVTRSVSIQTKRKHSNIDDTDNEDFTDA